jgi:NAD-dependent deacetylase
MRQSMDVAAQALREAQAVVVFTGAGMSAESGVPTFRDALTGLWERFDATELATPEAFARDPDLVWGWYEWRRAMVMRARPNPGHVAVATIAAQAPGCVLVTQNVDDLHERAGSRPPIRLHGSLFAPRCSGCATAAVMGELADQPAEGGPVPPPRCENCGARIRPGVVWFGEALPEASLVDAVAAARTCDLLITVGTSGVVYPAAEIPRLAARSGATVVQINPQRTPLDEVATVNLPGTAASVLPALVDAAWPVPPRTSV